MAAVSVVIPAHNPGRFIELAVASALAQDIDVEVVVVDDGSSEDLSGLATDRVRVVRQNRRGAAAARNRGIVETSAPLVAFLDSDDVWLPGKLKAQIVELAACPQAPACSTGFEVIDSNGVRIGPGWQRDFHSYKDFLHGDGVSTSTVVARRSALENVGGFAEHLINAQDWDLWLRLTRNGNDFIRVDRVLAQCRRHGQNATLNYRAILHYGTSVLAAQLDGPEPAAARAGIRRFRRLVGAQAFDAFRANHRVADLVNALRLSPMLSLRQLSMAAVNRVRISPAARIDPRTDTHSSPRSR